MPIAALDTTVLSNFAHVRRPDLLAAALGADLVTTPLVLAELRTGEASGHVPTCDWNWLPVAHPTAAEQRLAAELTHQLDPGEAECLAVALTRAYRFLSDDFAARRLAVLKGLAVSGTVGVLTTLVEMGQLSLPDADELLTQMIACGYRSPVRSLNDLYAG